MTANDKQVAGSHYKGYTYYGIPIDHWDVVQVFGLGYMEGQITKYVMRASKKNGVEDLRKAAHYLEKLIEQWEAPKTAHAEFIPYRTMHTLYPHVKPDGWVNHQFEGIDQEGALWRCRKCHAHFRTPADACPDDFHMRHTDEYYATHPDSNDGAEPDKRYTNQDGIGVAVSCDIPARSSTDLLPQNGKETDAKKWAYACAACETKGWIAEGEICTRCAGKGWETEAERRVRTDRYTKHAKHG
jgi:hypothetical protein